MLLSDGQRRLLGELESWQILALADAPQYWCKYIRDTQGCGSARNPEWQAAAVWRATYSWGLAMTAAGDYMRERKRDDPAHLVTLTWAEITRWFESLPAELRTLARKGRNSDTADKILIAEQILAAAVGPTQEALW